MKNVLCLGLLLLSVSILSAQTKTDKNAPKIQFEPELVDYGTIENGSNGMRELKVVNAGKKPLIISTIQSGDGGLYVYSFPKEPVAPGKSAIIQIKYDTKRYGPFTRVLTVISNATEPSRNIIVKGFVTPPKEIKGDSVKAGSPVPGE